MVPEFTCMNEKVLALIKSKIYPILMTIIQIIKKYIPYVHSSYVRKRIVEN